MAICAQCGNDYAKSFDVTFGGANYSFDSFECAIQKLAPECGHCGCKILGHGTDHGGVIYCCDHCARQGAA
ncbi:hypothetical protein [Roseinatronobacter sp.]